MVGAPDMNREPCPDRILEDAGGAFGMGAVGGSAYHFARGLYNSPNGHRLAGGATAAASRPRFPIVGRRRGGEGGEETGGMTERVINEGALLLLTDSPNHKPRDHSLSARLDYRAGGTAH